MSVKFDFKTLGQPFERDWPVKVMVPQDGGGFEEQTFLARFRLLEPADFEESAAAKEDEEGLMRRFFVGLGDGVPLTDEMLGKMRAAPYVARAIFKAWNEFQTGAPAKN